MFGIAYVHHGAEGNLEAFENDAILVRLVSRIILSSEIPMRSVTKYKCFIPQC